MVDAEKIPADSVADASGPLRVIATTLRKKVAYLGKTIGCGWSPNLARVNELTSDEYIANMPTYAANGASSTTPSGQTGRHRGPQMRLCLY